MDETKRIVTFLLTAMVVMPICVFAQRTDLMSSGYIVKWPNTMEDISAGNSIPKEEISRLLNSLKGAEVEPAWQVQEFRFAPISKGVIALAAIVDASGRELFYGLVILTREGAKYRRTLFTSAPPHFLPTEAVDLDGDGVVEIIVKEPVLDYRGAATNIVCWNSIYKYEEGSGGPVETYYPAYYTRSVLPYLSFLYETALKGGNETSARSRVLAAEIDFVRFKYQRKMNDEPRAGWDEALRWSQSKVSELQVLAIKTFEDMEGAEASERLEMLSRSPDAVVASRAAAALNRLRNKRAR